MTFYDNVRKHTVVSIISLFAFVLASAVQAASLPDFADLAEEQMPSVVIINTVQKTSVFGGRHQRGQMPDFFRYYFGEGYQMPEQKKEAQGSGIIMSDGYILTNHHVVAGADEITVRLHDRRVLDATLVGGDELSDLALLKVDADDLDEVELGDSDDLRVGEWVMAIGTPFGFDHSVTTGIVSAKDRTLSHDNHVPFIQTDVAINPGNSGGPLFNLDGELVGINSQIYSRTGGFMGLSFAIPVNVAMDVVEQLKDTGEVARGWLGVLIQDVDRNLARSLGLDKPMGAIVAKVVPDSPAEKGGLTVEDVILALNGREIRGASSLRNHVGGVSPGSKVEVVIFRQGKKKTLEFALGKLPQQASQASSSRTDSGSPAEHSILGMVVSERDLATGQRLQGEGVVVVVSVDGAAKEAGIYPGDVIMNVANTPVKSVSGLLDIVKKQKQGGWIPMLISRKGEPKFLAVEVR